MRKREGRKSAAQTPAPKSERIKGSAKNPKGSASSEKRAKSIRFNSKVINQLEAKLTDFKEAFPKVKTVSLSDLKAVYRRGAGAYSVSHRPTITGGKPNTRHAWAIARVNKFLKKAAGLKVKKAYVQDDDLLEHGGEISEKNRNSFYNWFLSWYKGIADKMLIMISFPNELQPIEDDNGVILDMFQKNDQKVDAKKYLLEILEKADKYRVAVYLKPIPRLDNITNSEKKKKITAEYLKKYFQRFGFKRDDYGYMKREPFTK